MALVKREELKVMMKRTMPRLNRVKTAQPESADAVKVRMSLAAQARKSIKELGT